MAHSNGSPTQGCSGCHFGGKTPSVSITPDSTQVDPGQLLNLTVSISAANGNAAGFFLTASVGSLSVVDSSSKLSGGGVTHSAPRTQTGGTVSFKVGWTAPTAPGGVDFFVWGNSVNGDHSSLGDGSASAFHSLAFGCAGSKFFRDHDGDGVGSESSGYTVTCSAPPSHSAEFGDCDDNDPQVFPGNREVCDSKDNDCNGQLDDGLPINRYCADADLDGHGVDGAATLDACGPSKGFGRCDKDCNDAEPSIYPGATELCNDRDDNCNDRIDEDARLVCGVGWCAQYALGCTSICTPGAPRVEECNDFDDDCDGVNDNGSDLELCGKAGLVCREGYCVASGSGGMSTGEGGSGNAGRPGAPIVSGGGSANESAKGTSARTGGCSFAANGRGLPLASAVLVALVALFRRRQANKFGPS